MAVRHKTDPCVHTMHTRTVGYQSLIKFFNLEECINCWCFVVYLQSIVLLYCELWQNRKSHTFNMHGWWIKHEMVEWRNRRLEQCLLLKNLHAMNGMRCDHSTRNKTRNVSLSERNRTQNKRIKCRQNTVYTFTVHREQLSTLLNPRFKTFKC